jgi:ankyrin repeat protein
VQDTTNPICRAGYLGH